MSDRGSTTTVAPGHSKGGHGLDVNNTDVGGPALERRPAPRGFLTQYKPDQGKTTRAGTFVSAGLLIAWGAKFLNDRLAGYQGDEAWRLLVTPGIPILAAIVFGTLAWHLTFVRRRPSDFMIATEGEMKKVNWSSKAEVIGSTKVVILFTLLMAGSLFFVDLLFQKLFSLMGVLKG